MQTIIAATIRDTDFRLRADWSDRTSAVEIDADGYEWQETGHTAGDYLSPVEALTDAVHAHFDDWQADDLTTAVILRAATFDDVPVLSPDVSAAAFGRRAFGASDIATADDADTLPGWWLHMVEVASCGHPESEHLIDIYRAAVARIVGADRAATLVGAVGAD